MDKSVGIVSYGAYIPESVIKSGEIAQAHNGKDMGPVLGVEQKTVPGIDEDSTTIAVEAAYQAYLRLTEREFLEKKMGVIFVGSESHPYAVKPTSGIVAQALGLQKYMAMADMQFACKAGTQSLQACFAYVKSKMADFGLAIGVDTAQSRPGDVLEYTAGAGGAAFFVGRENLLAEMVGTVSVATDTPDFWRRPRQEFPEHAGRFSGEPAYFNHILTAGRKLLSDLDMKISDFDYCIFHTPNGKFPKAVAKTMGCSEDQIKHSLVVRTIGNTYAAASLMALTNVLDQAKGGEKIFMASYGSGAGSDCFAFNCAENMQERKADWNNFLSSQIGNRFISYSEYRKRTEK
ncbi:MAG: hydroxymethylglutaryl-CoA synthase [Candidatus Shapirobacteria bacterium]|jgi:hydroxymethylglutaryl-CoA synthase